MTTWIKDDQGNKCSVKYWGSEAEAKKALASNKNCKNCSDCSDCSGCSGCSHCSYCSGCSDCSRCSGCSRCSDCSRCSGCSDCSRCSDCSYCSRCSGCSRCSYIASLYNKEKLSAEPSEGGLVGPPPVPTIPYIHKTIYAAASAPDALDMGIWHTCQNTHCRAGWAVSLAGDAGRKLEAFYNTPLAAMLIYDASDPNFKINPGRFYDVNDDALADMKRLAET